MRINYLAQGCYCHGQQIQTRDLTIEIPWSYHWTTTAPPWGGGGGGYVESLNVFIPIHSTLLYVLHKYIYTHIIHKFPAFLSQHILYTKQLQSLQRY